MAKNLKVLTNSDLPEIEAIHNKFYKDEFELPNFYNNFLSAYSYKDGNQIVSAGGVRLIAEAVIVTNKDIEIGKRRMALLEMLRCSAFTAVSHNLHQLHAFVQDGNWARHLKKSGFNETVGKCLVINL